MNNWWKSPVLQGPENDYGDYDYLIEELPKDIAKWEWFGDKCRCDSCGKYHHLNFYSVHYFHTYDGWDSMDYTECWRCDMGQKLCFYVRKIKRKIRVLKTTIRLYKLNRKDYKRYSIVYWYKIARNIER